ncbi:MAG: hypothetical protein JWN94_1024 [Betaproteobacteria bacterium]|nr:hypothetical protein [Betaproteobacteria bacterium]
MSEQHANTLEAVTKVVHTGSGNFEDTEVRNGDINNDAAPEPAVRANGDLVTRTVGDQTTQQGLTRVSAADFEINDGTLLSTARNNFGLTSNHTPQTLVDYEGTQINLATAEQLGLVKRDSNGKYIEIPAGAQPQATQEGNGAGEYDMLPDASEATIDAINASVPSQLIDQIVGQMANTLDLSKVNINNIANTCGLDHAVLHGQFSHITAAFQSQANAAVKSVGAEPAEVWAWARENAKEELQQAFLHQVHGRSTAKYKALATRALRATTPSGADAQRAGHSVRVVGGVELITLPGKPEVNMATAAQLGWI